MAIYTIDCTVPGSPTAELELRRVCWLAEPGDTIEAKSAVVADEVEARLAILGKPQTLDLLAKGQSMDRAKRAGVYVRRGG